MPQTAGSLEPKARCISLKGGVLQDLYGNAVAGSFISALSRLLTFYLQMHGFTCGFDDLLLVPEAEEQRRVMLETAETAALHASARFVGEEVPQLLQGGQESGSPLRQSLVPVSDWIPRSPQSCNQAVPPCLCGDTRGLSHTSSPMSPDSFCCMDKKLHEV